MKPIRLMGRSRWAINDDGIFFCESRRSLESHDRMPNQRVLYTSTSSQKNWYIDVSGNSWRRERERTASGEEKDLWTQARRHVMRKNKNPTM